MSDIQQLAAPEWCKPGATVIRKCAGVQGPVWLEDTVHRITDNTVELRSGALFRAGSLEQIGTSATYRDRLFPAADPSARVALAASVVKRSATELSRVARTLSEAPEPNRLLIQKLRDLASRLAQSERHWELALDELDKVKSS